ncbi:hypothetical protein [Paracoccus beibuensis]|uniref:hypothetical protein n=1 Tax=Paracoccus beibuensis TaxID=547602 RepID=UPI00223FE288|nr:hypothetical protein [Paracoccus beibuensis]
MTDQPTHSPIILGADAIRGFAAWHGVTPAEFVSRAADHVMTTIPADNEDRYAIVPLNQCEWRMGDD